MTGLGALWLPILLSSVAVFVVSSVIHMMSPWHKSDYPKLANEDKAMDVLRALAIPPGDYFIPRPSSREEMRSPQFAEKMKKGPVVVMTCAAQQTPRKKRLAVRLERADKLNLRHIIDDLAQSRLALAKR